MGHDAIPGCFPIAPAIWMSPPPSSVSKLATSSPATDHAAPSVVLLLSWTGADGRHVSKYIDQYGKLFPSTRMMVITTSAYDLIMRSSDKKRKRLLPALSRLRVIHAAQQLDGGGRQRGFLMHVFSEGGCDTACRLAEAYYNTTGLRLPVSALCLDSTPGRPSYLRLCDALAKSLPPIPILKQLSLLVAGGALGVIWVIYHVFVGFENNLISRSRRCLLDSTYFDHSAPRCYLYSTDDSIVPWEEVSKHAGDSKRMGIPVTEILFDCEHVSHARHDPCRYWHAVKSTWERVTAMPTRSSLFNVPIPASPELDLALEYCGIDALERAYMK